MLSSGTCLVSVSYAAGKPVMSAKILITGNSDKTLAYIGKNEENSHFLAGKLADVGKKIVPLQRILN